MQAYSRQLETPAGEQPIVWSIAVNRALEAAARILWPFGDTRLNRRLHRIVAPTLLIFGKSDKVVPPAYARRFADGISGKVTTQMLAGSGHLVELDRPVETAAGVLGFVR
jgi:pimeloyl-ACP methyl ester carboxylesterase